MLNLLSYREGGIMEISAVFPQELEGERSHRSMFRPEIERFFIYQFRAKCHGNFHIFFPADVDLSVPG